MCRVCVWTTWALPVSAQAAGPRGGSGQTFRCVAHLTFALRSAPAGPLVLVEEVRRHQAGSLSLASRGPAPAPEGRRVPAEAPRMCLGPRPRGFWRLLECLAERFWDSTPSWGPEGNLWKADRP